MMFDSQPRYSPDGAKIVFLSDRSGDENIWIANRDGSDPQPLTKGRTRAISRLSGRPMASTSSCLKTADRAGRSSGCITSTAAAASTSPAARNGASSTRSGAAFGKDDRFVYFTERTAAGSVYNQMNFRWQLGVYDRQTGENFRMSDELGSAMRPVLSPDGRWLVYATRWDAQTGLARARSARAATIPG